MNDKIKAWVKMMESGRFTKLEGDLVSFHDPNCRCAIGCAIEIVGGRVVETEQGNYISSLGDLEIAELLDLDEGEMNSVVEFNDVDHMSLPEIAAEVKGWYV